jgi:hypothetical protein
MATTIVSMPRLSNAGWGKPDGAVELDDHSLIAGTRCLSDFLDTSACLKPVGLLRYDSLRNPWESYSAGNPGEPDLDMEWEQLETLGVKYPSAQARGFDDPVESLASSKPEASHAMRNELLTSSEPA